MLRAYTMVHADMQPTLWRERLKRLQTIPM